MKKLIPLILSGALLLGAAGCSGSGSQPSSAPSSAPEQSSAPQGGGDNASDVKIGILIPGSPTDGGFSQQGAEAGKNLASKYGYSVSTVEAGTADVIKAEAETMAAEGYKIVFGHGGQCSAPFAEICEDYPDTWFVTFGGTEIRDNLFPVVMCAEEGTYVLGVAAGMMTKTGNIAYTLGGDYPAYTKTTMGFALGAKSVNPSIKIQEAVLSSPDSNECYETTMSQINSGADMILSNANEGQAGAMKAVTESSDVYTFGCLGNFFDMAPGKVLGNIIGDYNVGYDNATSAIMDGTVEADYMFLTIANGCVTVDWNPDVALPADVQAAVDQTYEDIKSGKIDVPNEYEQDAAKELLASYK
ncbi:BMP family protein [Pseudoflavonifractor sp. 524-17]|uniref:BMP family lipoprotein n=1 Tax=Pseudoflavonifractor sp. 524-17 TaxID=2304577 RepID=UPI0013793FEE|nr:BMP family protein [Pseudoflavonifractor sp. 524-17]